MGMVEERNVTVKPFNPGPLAEYYVSPGLGPVGRLRLFWDNEEIMGLSFPEEEKPTNQEELAAILKDCADFVDFNGPFDCDEFL